MNLLLDTHVFLWAIGNNPKLSSAARGAITTGNNLVYVSAATAWEIAIKTSLGKLNFTVSDYEGELAAHRFTALPITNAHALGVKTLPDLHKDPFDRLLIAQAQHEKFTLVTADRRIAEYDVKTLW